MVARQIIDVSGGGVEYTQLVTITETAGADITADQVWMGFGTYRRPPTSWLAGGTPAVLVNHPQPSVITVKALVSASTAPTAGDWYLWWKVVDATETIKRNSGLPVTIRT